MGMFTSLAESAKFVFAVALIAYVVQYWTDDSHYAKAK
jgi:hypothetical protein